MSEQDPFEHITEEEKEQFREKSHDPADINAKVKILNELRELNGNLKGIWHQLINLE